MKEEQGQLGSTVSVNLEEFTTDVSQLVEGKTYAVSVEHTLNTTLTLPKNITLIFLGGTITGSGTLTADQTRLEAPITRIFGDNLIVGGTWVIDRAYPQWFGAKPSSPENEADAADAINKAILMKRTGEVFIPRGDYQIGKTIIIKFGINLCGENGRPEPNPLTENAVRSTTLKPINGTNGHFYGNYMIMSNVLSPNDNTTQENANWEYQYPIPGTVIKNIFFSNQENQRKHIKGILAAGSIELYNLTWIDFVQGFAFANLYSDLKKIERCSFSLMTENICKSDDGNVNDKYYAFDFNGLGDGLICTGNAIHDGIYNYGIKISGSNGANISSNIVNADTLIEYGKTIIFDNNHCESGVQIKIKEALVQISNNFLWKGERPSIIIEGNQFQHTPVVTLENNAFLFLDADGKDITPKICQYDIQTDGKVSLQITNSYRYWVTRGFGAHYTFGLTMCDMSENPVAEFNNQCHLLSTAGTMKPNYFIINNIPVRCVNINLFLLKNNDTIRWYGNSGKYYYKYEILWDKKRNLKKNIEIVPDINELDNGVTVTFDGAGVLLLALGDLAKCGFQAIIRLYRGTSPETMNHCVEVPISGAQHLYDNGISICGFRWKEIPISTDNEFNIKSIKYNGDNCECWGYSCPTSGVWEEGDIVYNIGTATNNTLWVYTETYPGSGVFEWKTR